VIERFNPVIELVEIRDLDKLDQRMVLIGR
jgi:hypothetical protein